MASFKMYSTAAVALILASIFSTNAQSNVPVLLWESSKVGENGLTPAALSAMDVEEFGDVLMRRLDGNPVVALFLENSLSVEDFSRQGSSKRSSFPALQSMRGGSNARLEFIPAVQSPVKALNRLSKLGYEWEQISGEALPEAGKKILVVNLGDLRPDEDRSEMLLRHDKAVASLLKQMTAKYSDVLALYTGSHSSWTAPKSSSVRVRRDADDSDAGAVISSPVGPNQIMLYTSEFPVLTVNKTDYNLNSPDTSSPVDVRKESQRFVVRYKLGNSSVMITIRFRFNFADAGYWNLSQVEYENSNEKSILDSITEIKAPLNISYSCGREAIFRSTDGDVILRLKNVMVQPGVQDSVFSPSLDCISFFTIPIWSGLLVTFLLLFIVAWGIDMMMSIHTMDRFDDPKGKPLVFNAQE